MSEHMEFSRGLAPGLTARVPADVLAARAVPVLTFDLLQSLNEAVSHGDAEDALIYLMDYHGFHGKLRELLEECAELTKATTGLMDGRGMFSEWVAELIDVQNVIEQFILRFKEDSPEHLVLARSIRKAKIHRALSQVHAEQVQALLTWRTENPNLTEPASIAGGE